MFSVGPWQLLIGLVCLVGVLGSIAGIIALVLFLTRQRK
jgi:hypothetical protein